MNIEDIAQIFEAIPPPTGDSWTVQEVATGRLFLGKAEGNRAAVFVEGERSSFGELPASPEIQHSDRVIAVPSGRTLQALRITSSDDTNGFRIIAHLLYEFAWRLEKNPQLENEELLGQVSWLFALLGGARLPMSEERQLGLVGELIFLRRLLRRALDKGVDIRFALQCWAGANFAKRDFYGNKVAVEVKTTSQIARLHRVTSLDQLAPQEMGEDVYLFSLGIRRDPTAPKKLSHFVSDVEAVLLDKNGSAIRQAIDDYHKELHAYGYARGDSDLYDRQSGFLAPHLAPELFFAANLGFLRPSHFVDGKPPETVRSISYALEVTTSALPATTGQVVLDQMLGIK